MADGFKDPVQVARTALAMKRVCDLDRWKDSTGKYHQAVHDHLTALTAERDALRAEVERLRDVLSAIEIMTATGDGLSPVEAIQLHIMAGNAFGDTDT